MIKKIVRKAINKTKKNNFLILLLLLVVTSAIFIFSNIVSRTSISTDSNAAINCRNYNKKQCPVNKGCMISGNMCVANPSYQQDIFVDCNSAKGKIIQVMYQKSAGVQLYYAGARVATGKELSLDRILTGGLSPRNVKTKCVVSFKTCYGNVQPKDSCIEYDPKNPTPKLCSEICQQAGRSWCTVAIDTNNANIFYGCKTGTFSTLYRSIPLNAPPGSTLHSCKFSNETSDLAYVEPYGKLTSACCDQGCESIVRCLRGDDLTSNMSSCTGLLNVNNRGYNKCLPCTDENGTLYFHMVKI